MVRSLNAIEQMLATVTRRSRPLLRRFSEDRRYLPLRVSEAEPKNIGHQTPKLNPLGVTAPEWARRSWPNGAAGVVLRVFNFSCLPRSHVELGSLSKSGIVTAMHTPC